jgi:hypothetical protein
MKFTYCVTKCRKMTLKCCSMRMKAMLQTNLGKLLEHLDLRMSTIRYVRTYLCTGYVYVQYVHAYIFTYIHTHIQYTHGYVYVCTCVLYILYMYIHLLTWLSVYIRMYVHTMYVCMCDIVVCMLLSIAVSYVSI